MKKERTKGFVSGVAASVLVFSLVGTAAATIGSRTLTADYSNIKIIVEGIPVTPTDANGTAVEPFAVNGTTYLPVRAIGNALGMDVEWIPERNVVELSSKKGNYQYDKCYYSYSVPDFETVVGADAYVKLDSPDNKNDMSFYYDPDKFEEDAKGSYLKEYGELLGKFGFSFSEHRGDDWIYYSWLSGMTVRVGTESSTGYVVIEIKMPEEGKNGTTTVPVTTPGPTPVETPKQMVPSAVGNGYSAAPWIPDFGKVNGVSPRYFVDDTSIYATYITDSFDMVETYIAALERAGMTYDDAATTAFKEGSTVVSSPMVYSYSGSAAYMVVIGVGIAPGEVTIFVPIG